MIDLNGRKFGRLTVVSEAERRYSKGGHSKIMWNCDCGNKRILSSSALTSGNTKSCDCYRKEENTRRCTKHGLTKTKLYSVWDSMKDRCYCENSPQYKDYGGRGITVCNEWRNDFLVFRKWAYANGYKEGLTIERKDVDGNYCPENCCWIPRAEQSRNRTNCHYITYKGETKTLSEWSRELGIDRECVRNQEKKLGSGEKAIENILNSPQHKGKIRETGVC